MLIFIWRFVCKDQIMLHFVIFNNFCINVFHSPSESKRCWAKRVISRFKLLIKMSKNGCSLRANDVNQIHDPIVYVLKKIMWKNEFDIIIFGNFTRLNVWIPPWMMSVWNPETVTANHTFILYWLIHLYPHFDGLYIK